MLSATSEGLALMVGFVQRERLALLSFSRRQLVLRLFCSLPVLRNDSLGLIYIIINYLYYFLMIFAVLVDLWSFDCCVVWVSFLRTLLDLSARFVTLLK